MSAFTTQLKKLPPDQQAILERCYHPSGIFTEFGDQDVEQSVPDCFAQIVRKHTDRSAVKFGDEVLTYAEINQAANRIAHEVLGKRGKGQEPIALILGKGVDLVAAMLGVFESREDLYGIGSKLSHCQEQIHSR